MKWKAEEVAVIVLNEYFFSACFLNESLFFLIGWHVYLAVQGHMHTHLHQHSTCKSWGQVPPGQASLLGRSTRQRPCSPLPLPVCFAEKFKTVATHTRPPEGSFLPNTSVPLTCHFKANAALPIVLPPTNHMRLVLRLPGPGVSNWPDHNCVSVCACVCTGLSVCTCARAAGHRVRQSRVPHQWTELRVHGAEALYMWPVASTEISKFPPCWCLMICSALGIALLLIKKYVSIFFLVIG